MQPVNITTKRWFVVIKLFLRLIPSTLKYRLFLAFILFILLPFSVLNLANFSQVETLMQQNTIKQNQDQLDRLKTSLEDYIGAAFKTRVLLQQDETLTTYLKEPESLDGFERQKKVESRLLGITNSFFLSSLSIYYTLLDLKGNAYSTFWPSFSLNYAQIAGEKWFTKLTDKNSSGEWIADYGENYVRNDITSSPQLMSFYSTLQDAEFQPYAVLRISLDYYSWFAYQAKINPTPSSYYLITQEGQIMTPPGGKVNLPALTIQKLIHQAEPKGYFIDPDSNSIYNFNYMPSVDSYLVSQVPSESIFSEINKQKDRFFLTVLILTVVFVIISFGISTTITRPLANLRKKMSGIAGEELKILLPEKNSSGEVLDLIHSFNKMLLDLNISIEQSKHLERQKESLRFQALVAQMNPHFLLNTLNNIKWLALRDGNQNVAEICIALGKVLETSLNLEVDLVTLQTEIDLVKAYISIQEFRFDRQFDVTYDFEESLSQTLVPKLCLQVLVENTITHGFSTLDVHGLINIRAFLDNSNVTLEVEDNGIGFETAQQLNAYRPRKGIGMSNLKERLALLYQTETSFEVIKLPRGALVRLSFPHLEADGQIERSNFNVESITGRG
jgi:two-component system, sensor histidine kinase YesM